MTNVGPIDYDAWNRGYQPPTEHVLAHALMYEGAKVIYYSSTSGNLIALVVGDDSALEEDDFDVLYEFVLPRLMKMVRRRNVRSRGPMIAEDIGLTHTGDNDGPR